MFIKSRDGFNLPMRDGLSSKDTILTYKLEEWQLNLLCESIKAKQINGRTLKIFVTDDFTDIYVIPHFIAFLNFRSVRGEEKQGFFDFWHECLRPPSPEEKLLLGDEKLRMDLTMPPTYILNCHFPNIDKMPYLYVNSDIFADKNTLRLALLQEIKNLESKGKASQNSIRLRRVLKTYILLIYRGWITKKELDKREDPISIRMFQKDMKIIKEIDPNVEYESAKRRYVLRITQEAKEVDSKLEPPRKFSMRLQRVLWMYRQLTYKGWIDKEVMDRWAGPLSLRTFQRDMRIIRELDHNVEYDSANNRYVLCSIGNGSKAEQNTRGPA